MLGAIFGYIIAGDAWARLNAMTGATTLFVPLLTACASALAVPALLGSRPIRRGD